MAEPPPAIHCRYCKIVDFAIEPSITGRKENRMTKTELREVLEFEGKIYAEIMGSSKKQRLIKIVKCHPDYYTWRYVKSLRKAGYFYSNREKNLLMGLLYLWACRKKNKLGRKLGIEMNEKTCGKGLVIYHTQGIVVNGNTEIGEGLILHGNNCIGTDGITKDCPVIGNHVRLGVGAKVLGGVHIADNVVIAAGAVVVHTCEEENVVLAGVPAKIVKRHNIQNPAGSAEMI